MQACKGREEARGGISPSRPIPAPSLTLRLSLWRRPLALLHPFRRAAWLLLAWSHRHSLALWWRSLRAELTGGRPIDLGRVRRLAAVLMRVTADPRISNASELKLRRR